jgi:hypothetical protein
VQDARPKGQKCAGCSREVGTEVCTVGEPRIRAGLGPELASPQAFMRAAGLEHATSCSGAQARAPATGQPPLISLRFGLSLPSSAEGAGGNCHEDGPK